MKVTPELSEHFRQLQKKSWLSQKTNKTKERFQRMQALSVLARKKNKEKLSTDQPVD